MTNIRLFLPISSDIPKTRVDMKDVKAETNKYKFQKKNAIARQVVFAVLSPFAELDLTGPLTVFQWANMLCQAQQNAPAYKLLTVSAERGKKLAGECGLNMNVDHKITNVTGAIDTLIVVGGNGSYAAEVKTPFVVWLKNNALHIRRIASVCTGAFVLGAAGLLDGRRATTHWATCAELAARYPKAVIEESPIFVRDGNIYTSAGVTAGMDLALELVENDLGSAIALEIARNMVLFLRRPGGQSQFSASLAAQIPERQSLRELQVWIAENLRSPLNVEQLAERVAMSPRNFARVFARETGITPANYIITQRLEAARRELEQTNCRQDEISVRCGFGTTDNFRRIFIKKLGITPGQYRAHFKQARISFG